MEDRTYRFHLLIDATTISDLEELPTVVELQDVIETHLLKLKRSNPFIDDVLVTPDAINKEFSPPMVVRLGLHLVQLYMDALKERFADSGFAKAAAKGVEQIEKGIHYLRGCLESAEELRHRMEISPLELSKDNISLAPEPLLHVMAHQMGLEDCAGMDKDTLVTWIKTRLEKDQPKPN